MRYWRQLRQFKPVLTLNVVVAVGLLCWLMFSDYGLRAEFERRVVDVDVKPYVNPSKSPSSSVGSDVTTIPSSAAPKKSHATIVKPLKLEPEAIEEDVTNGRVPNTTALALAPNYHTAILDPQSTIFPRLECPTIIPGRYNYLRTKSSNQTSNTTTQRPYYFAINLHDNIAILPRLLGSVIETMRFLGLAHTTLSIIEGRSTDGTYEILNSLIPILAKEGITYHFNSSTLDPESGDRIGKLAALRNAALAPLHDDEAMYGNATVIFLNDVAICMEDILELIHQRVSLGADMVCGMDWKNLWKDPTFYDVWIARTITGDSLFEIGTDGSWDSAWNLFWSDPTTKERFEKHLPFQVFSCWNGGAVFSARPLFETFIAFRAPREGECFNGEPSIFCKELWWHGYGKIAVVPTVNLEYSDEGAKLAREMRGTPSRFPLEVEESKVEWQKEPPEKVRCVTNYDHQTWGAWNESMPGVTRH